MSFHWLVGLFPGCEYKVWSIARSRAVALSLVLVGMVAGSAGAASGTRWERAAKMSWCRWARNS